MPSHMMPFAIFWAILAVVVIVLIVCRKTISTAEDDSLHVLEPGTVQQQAGMAAKLERIDKWGKSLTIVVVVYGLILAGVYFYQSWMASSNIGV